MRPVLLLALTVGVAGCQFVIAGLEPSDGATALLDEGPANADLVGDGAMTVLDLTGDTATMPPPDLTGADFANADLSVLPDFALPDFALPDFALPDFALPDFALPDFTTLADIRSDLVVLPDLRPDMAPKVISFANAATVALRTGANPTGIASASMSNALDSNIDLVIADFGATAQSANGYVAVLLGVGNGTFGVPLPFNAGTNPVDVAIGNLTQGTGLDVAVTNYNGSNVTVLHGDTFGGLDSPVNVTTGALPHRIALGDINNSGGLDLLLSSEGTDNLNWSYNSSGGNFGAFTGISTKGAGGGSAPRGIAIGQFDTGDTFLDVVLADTGVHKLSVFLNTNGTTFGGKQDINLTAGATPQDIVAAHLNGDSFIDLAVTENGLNRVTIFLGNGNGGFAAGGNFATGNKPFHIVAADFDGDGRTDLAVTNRMGSSVSVLPGNGNGTFQTALTFTIPDAPYDLTVNDFNSDGKLDIALTGDVAAYILLNNTP